MSYCVNCGVELEKTIKSCPLCNTKVNNPKQPVDDNYPKPYPHKKAVIEPADRKETALLLSIILLSPSIGCVIMNFLILGNGFWSLYVMGACAILWTFIVLPLILKKLPNIVYITLDALIVIAYIYVFALQFGNKGWFQYVAIPIVVVISILILGLLSLYEYYKPSIITMTISIISSIGVLCIAIEIILNLYLKDKLYIFWSAIVAICCFMIIIPLAIIIKRPKLREEIRRRMHV